MSVCVCLCLKETQWGRKEGSLVWNETNECVGALCVCVCVFILVCGHWSVCLLCVCVCVLSSMHQRLFVTLESGRWPSAASGRVCWTSVTCSFLFWFLHVADSACWISETELSDWLFRLLRKCFLIFSRWALQSQLHLIRCTVSLSSRNMMSQSLDRLIHHQHDGGDHDRYPKPNHDVFPTQTKWISCRNLTTAEPQCCVQREVGTMH